MADAVFRLKEIAAQMRVLPQSLDFESRLNVERLAGALVLEAVGLGAFRGPKYTDLLNKILRAKECPSYDYPRQVFLETFAFLCPDFGGDLLEPYGLLANAIEAEASRLETLPEANGAPLNDQGGRKHPWGDDDPETLLSPAELAGRLGIPGDDKHTREALRKRLEKWRNKNRDGGWVEVADRKPKQAGYLYPVGRVWPVIEDMKRSG